VLGDHAYGENTWLRDRLHQAECEYVLSVGATTKVFEQGTVFAVPPKKPNATRGPVRPRPDRRPEPIGKLIGQLGADTTQTVTFRDGPDGEPVTSRFIFVRVHAAHGWRDDQRWTGWREGAEVPPREEWLIAEWPDDHDEPTDYWISNLPADTPLERLARLARMLDHLGLSSAITNLASDFERDSQVRVRREIARHLPPLDPRVELVVYRVAQESMTNVARHANASEVLVSLESANGSIVLRVVDNGRGFPQEQVEAGGLRGIRERALIANAAVAIKPGPDGGVEVRLEVPTSTV
jgi:hypothetical protein